MANAWLSREIRKGGLVHTGGFGRSGISVWDASAEQNYTISMCGEEHRAGTFDTSRVV